MASAARNGPKRMRYRRRRRGHLIDGGLGHLASQVEEECVDVLDATTLSIDDLVEFDAFEPCLDIPFAKAFIAFALDDFKEHRSNHRVGENLQ